MDNRKTKNKAHRIPQLVARPASAEYKRVWRAMRKVIDELAADHFEYVTGFLALWYRSSNIVDATAEGLICDGSIEVSDREILWTPYGMMTCVVYSRLMDNLNREEEHYFNVEMLHAEQSWQKFFAAVRLRHPELTDLADKGLVALAEFIAEESDLMLGERSPAITPRLVRNADALKKTFAEISRRVAR